MKTCLPAAVAAAATALYILAVPLPCRAAVTEKARKPANAAVAGTTKKTAAKPAVKAAAVKMVAKPGAAVKPPVKKAPAKVAAAAKPAASPVTKTVAKPAPAPVSKPHPRPVAAAAAVTEKRKPVTLKSLFSRKPAKTDAPPKAKVVSPGAVAAAAAVKKTSVVSATKSETAAKNRSRKPAEKVPVIVRNTSEYVDISFPPRRETKVAER